MPLFGRRKQSDLSGSSSGLLLGGAGVGAVCAAVGLPADLLDNGTIIQCILPACAAVFTDGDLVVRHSGPLGPGLLEWFGQETITEGRFFTRLAELNQNPDPAIQRPLEDLQRAVAALFARGVVFGDAPPSERGPFSLDGLKSTVPPLATIDGAEVVFGGGFGQPEYRERLDGPVQYLLAIEPGIRLMHVIDQQVELLARPAFTYNYMCVTSRPFVDQFLSNYVLLRTRRASGHDRIGEQMFERGFVIPAEGDAAESLGRLIDRDRAIGETHGRVDLAFFVGVRMPRLTHEQARRILTGVHFLLRPRGALLIGFPSGPQAPHNLSATDLNVIAAQAGFTGGPRVHLDTNNIANPELPAYSFFRKD